MSEVVRESPLGRERSSTRRLDCLPRSPCTLYSSPDRRTARTRAMMLHSRRPAKHGVAARLRRRACASSADLWTTPAASATLPVYEDLTLQWDPSCVDITSDTVDLFLSVEHAAASEWQAVHEWTSVPYSAGQLATQLKPTWWNASSGAGSVQAQVRTLSGSQSVGPRADEVCAPRSPTAATRSSRSCRLDSPAGIPPRPPAPPLPSRTMARAYEALRCSGDPRRPKSTHETDPEFASRPQLSLGEPAHRHLQRLWTIRRIGWRQSQAVRALGRIYRRRGRGADRCRPPRRRRLCRLEPIAQTPGAQALQCGKSLTMSLFGMGSLGN